ncbi:MAG TPA: O-antigen ligase family protein [Candidatus Aquicultor sp.]
MTATKASIRQSAIEAHSEGHHQNRRGTSNTSSFAERVLKILLYVVLAIVPLIVFPSSLDQAFAIKYLLLKAITIAAICVYLVALLARGGRLRLSGLEVPFLAFLGLAAISTALSINTPTSLEGAYLRYDGLYSYLIMAALLFLASQVIKTADDLRRFASFAVGSAALVSLYGLLQRAGIDPVRWGYVSFGIGRSFATLGNPITLGGYLTIMLPVAISLVKQCKSQVERYLCGMASILIGLCLLATGSRGALIGVLCGMVVYIVLTRQRNVFAVRTTDFREESNAIRLAPARQAQSEVQLSPSVGASQPTKEAPLLRIPRAVRLSPVLVALVVLTFALAATTVAVPAFNMHTTLTDASSINTRLLMWQSAARMAIDRPLTGFGPDSLGIVFPQYELEELAKLVPDQNQDNVHNAFLQMAVTLGFPALLVFVFIVAFVILKSKDRILLNVGGTAVEAGLLAGIVGFIIQSLTNVTGIMPAAFLWLFLGALAAPFATGSVAVRPASGYLRYPAIIAVCIMGIVGMLASVHPFLSDMALGKARMAEQNGDLQQARIYYKTAIAHSKNDTKPYRELGIMLTDTGAQQGNIVAWLEGIEYLERGVQRSPNDQQNLILLGQGYLYGGKAFDRMYLKDAERYLKQAVYLRPNSYIANGMLGAVYLETGRLTEAKAQIDIALDINPNDSQAMFCLGRYYEMTGQRDKALAEYKHVLSLAPGFEKAQVAYKGLVADEK